MLWPMIGAMSAVMAAKVNFMVVVLASLCLSLCLGKRCYYVV